MKLCIKQKVFSWKDRFTVKDEWGHDKYFVEGKLFSWGKKLHVCDTNNGEVAFIQEKVWSFMPKFYVFINGKQVAEIVKKFTFLKPKYEVEGLGWTINGSFMQHDYIISSNTKQVAHIHKEWFTWGDCYSIDINDPEDEIITMAVVLAIDCAMASSSQSSSGMTTGQI